MGHVQALKLLHPTKHRSSFLELRDWLDKHNDQYEAKRIYKLGVKRKPSGAKNPKKNIYPELNEIFLKDTETPKKISNLRKIFTSKNYSKKVSIYNTVRSRVGRGWPTGALEYLSHHEKYFNDKEKSFLLSKIANGYYLANLDDKAINVLNDPSFISEPYSEGLWIKGLAFLSQRRFPNCIKTIFDFCLLRCSMVEVIARILVSSRTLPSFTGTFKSTLRTTVLLKTSVSPNFLILKVVFCFSNYIVFCKTKLCHQLACWSTFTESIHANNCISKIDQTLPRIRMQSFNNEFRHRRIYNTISIFLILLVKTYQGMA